MKKNILLLLLLILYAFSAQASKEDKIQELIQIMNLDNYEKSFEQQLIYPISCSFDIPAQDEDEIAQKISKIFNMKENIIAISTPFWAENYTEEELDQLLDFYKTDLGKKTIKLMPQMTQYIAEQQVLYQQKIAPDLNNFAIELSARYSKRTESEFRYCINKKLHQQ